MILPPLPDDIPFSEGEDIEGAAPNCAQCLVRMEPVAGARGERWRCAECGAVTLS